MIGFSCSDDALDCIKYEQIIELIEQIKEIAPDADISSLQEWLENQEVIF